MNTFMQMSSISIHAPTRGATSIISMIIFIFYISIHAPTRGATEIGQQKHDYHAISIHAPTRGATQVGLHPVSVKGISIHAPTRGATIKIGIFSILYEFQSTLPRGERQLLYSP